MSVEQIVALLIQYRYFILFPLAAIEGPIVALVAGFVIRLGYLSVLPSLTIMIFGDIIPDSIYYYLGRRSNERRFVEKYGARWPIIATHFALIEKLWRDHPGKTMFLGKLAYGLSIPFLISAGLVKMSYRKFLTYAVPVTIFQYGLIMAIGYYLGQSYQLAEIYIHDVYLALAIAVLILAGLYLWASKYARKEITKIAEAENHV